MFGNNTKRTTQLEKDIKLIDDYVAGLENLGEKADRVKDKENLFAKTIANASDQARIYVKQMDASVISGEDFAKTQTIGAKAVQLFSNGLKGAIASLGTMAISFAVSFAANLIFNAIKDWVNREKDLREAAVESSNALNEKSASIDEYVAKINELRTALDSGNLSEEEAYDTRKQLLALQTEVVEKYGDEVNGIDLLNGSLQTQIDKLNELKEINMRQWLTENSEAIENAQKALSNDKDYLKWHFGQYTLTQGDNKELQRLADKYKDYGVSFGTDSEGYEFKVSANEEEAKEVLSMLQKDIESGTKFSDYMQQRLMTSIVNAGKTAQSDIDTNKTVLDQAVSYQIQTNEHYKKLYADLQEASSEYAEAAARNDEKAIEEALQKSREALRNFNDDAFNELGFSDADNRFIKEYMQAEADQLTEASKQKSILYGLKDALDMTNVSYKQSAEYIDQLTESQKKYGNVSNIDRDIINWDASNLMKYQKQIDSWGWKNLRGSYSTVLGDAAYTGDYGFDEDLAFAFSALLETDNGLVPLTQDEFSNYIKQIISAATDKETGKIDASKMLELDANGLDVEVDGVITHVSNMLAAVEGQIVDGAKLTKADVFAISGVGEDELKEMFGVSSKYIGQAEHDIQEQALLYKGVAAGAVDDQAELLESAKKFADYDAMAEYFGTTKEAAKQYFAEIANGLIKLDGADDLTIQYMESLKASGDDLRGYSADMRSGFTLLSTAAEQLDIPLDDLIDTLVELGLVTGNAIKYTNEFTNDAITAATNTNKAISLVTAAMQTQSTTAGVTSDSYAELIKEHGEYAAALEFENGYMKLNTDMTKEITQAKIDEAEADIKVAYSQNQMKYAQVKADLEALNREEKNNTDITTEQAEQIKNARTALEEQSKQLRENCRNLQMQYSLLVQNSGAYQDWVNAQSATESGAMYDSIIEAKKAIAEGLNNGKVGTEKFKAAVELTIPEDYQGDIANYVKRLNRYFKQASDGSADASGLNNFIADSIKAGLMSKDADDQIKIAADKTTKDFADALHLSMEDVQSIWGELSEYGWEFDWGSLLGNPVDNLRMQIDDVKDKMDDLGEDAVGSELWNVLNDKLEELQVQLKATFTDVDADTINNTLEDIIAESKKAAGTLTESQQDTVRAMGRMQALYDLTEAQKNVKQLQSDFQTAMDNGAAGAEEVATQLTNAQMQVETLTQQCEQLGEPTALEIQTFSADYLSGKIDGMTHDAEELKEMLGSMGISIDTYTTEGPIEEITGNVEAVKNTAENIVMEIDTTKAMSGIQEVQSAFDSLHPTIKVGVSVMGGLITIGDTGIKTSRSAKGSDTASNAAGTPYARGGKTLVGELGNELVVNPQTGKWYTVGDNGAEFVNLPHGAIVFNHEKTEQLLKNGFVGGYGEALASGTAMDAGSPGVDSYLKTAGNNYLPGKNPQVLKTYKAATDATKDNTTALENNKKALEKQKTALEKQKTELEKVSNKLKIYGQAAIDEIEKREKALNKEKDARDKAWDDEKKQLEDRKQALQDANDEEDRAIKLAELKDALEKAKANRTVRIYNRNQGFIWAADQESVNDAQTSLDEQQRDWRREDAIKAIEDEIDKIDELKEAYDDQIEAEIDKLDDLKDKWNEVMGLIGTDWDDYQAQLAAAALFSNMSFEGMTDDLVGYKDDVLANMQEIGGITDQIDGITDSIEKLEESIEAAKDAASGSSKTSGNGTALGLGTDTGNDVTEIDDGEVDIAESAQKQINVIDELKEKIQNTSIALGDLRKSEKDCADTLNDVNLVGAQRAGIMQEYEKAQRNVADAESDLTALTDQYTAAILAQTDVSSAAKDAQIADITNLLMHHTGTYDAIKNTLSSYTDAVIESTDLTGDEFVHSMDTIRGLGECAGLAADDMQELLYANVDAVTENTELTNEQRQLQIEKIAAIGEQYGLTKDEIIQHLTEVAVEEESSAARTAESHQAMIDTVQAACTELNLNYDTVISKIQQMAEEARKAREELEALAQAKKLENIGEKVTIKGPGGNKAVSTVARYATGILDSATTHIAITDEKGPEIKMRKPSVGQYSLIERGSSVIPAEPSANLWKFGLDPENFIAQHMTQRSIKSVEITQPNMGNGVNVNVGDIQMYGVNDVDSFGRVIHEKIGGIFAQEFNRR